MSDILTNLHVVRVLIEHLRCMISQAKSEVSQALCPASARTFDLDN